MARVTACCMDWSLSFAHWLIAFHKSVRSRIVLWIVATFLLGVIGDCLHSQWYHNGVIGQVLCFGARCHLFKGVKPSEVLVAVQGIGCPPIKRRHFGPSFGLSAGKKIGAYERLFLDMIHGI
jgi:hypothetical protein